MPKRTWLAAAMTCVVALPALACGPDFPEVLLDNRAATLAELPEGVFSWDATRLVPAPGAFAPAERAEWLYTTPPPTREQIERGLLGADFDRGVAIRQRVGAAVAYAAGDGLPEDARRYLAGAAAFAHGHLGDAAQRFASVLELPAAERPRYSVWAAYMLGRSLADSDAGAAAGAFRQVRSLVAAGAVDPLGLAADSYGEEARLRLTAGDDAGAIALYAQQAALQSNFGVASLLQVARAIVADPKRLERAIGDPLAQRLVTTYLVTRGEELDADQAGDGADADATDAKPADGRAADVIAHFLGAVDARGLAHVDGVGRLAALAYRNGRYDLATKFAARGNDAMSAWVRAKLALRAGNAAAAATAYAEAAKAFPHAEIDAQKAADDTAVSSAGYCRLKGETGTLALARGEYVAAFENLYAAAPTYWFDAAYMADRVLGVDELKQFVDRNVAKPPPPKSPPVGYDTNPAAGLRALLARRLLREGRYDEALAYFDDDAVKAKAVAYAQARRAAESGGRIERAENWYRAAVIARNDGMDLLGYELDPDGKVYDGAFEFDDGFGFAPVVAPADAAADAPAPVSLPIAVGPGADERARFVASKPMPDHRFHYRYLAADFAARAADLVPARSQAYAATLCHAAGYLVNRDVDAARAYYRRYVERGPHVPWATDFGTQCAEPDFVGAAKRLRAERIALARHYLRKAFPYALGVGALLAIAGVWAWRRRRVVSASPT